VLFYLGQLAKPGYSVFDFGGNTGVLFYNYQRRWTVPPNMQWTVCDVPAVIEAGREFAKTRSSEGLSFTSKFADAAGADLLFTSGTLQYVPETLGELVAKLGDAKPRHL
jgi:putative methyltransferase (TIGR04325 family)